MRVHNRLYPRNISRLLLVWLLAALCLPGSGQSPDTDVPADSLATLRTVPDTLAADTLPAPLAADTLPSDSLPSKKKSNPLDAKVEYAAQDSIVFWSNGTGFLHGEGDVKYKNITLKAEYIRVKMDSSLLYAKGTVDSIGDPVGDPVFGEGESEYNSKEITYNLQTGKGFVKNAVTQQGEGYIVSDNTKNWEFNRIALMDLVIMQIALAEILTFPNIPLSVTLNEYVDIAKVYSTPKSGAYVNGLLDVIAKKLMADKVLTKTIN